MIMEEKDWEGIANFARSEFVDDRGDCWIDRGLIFLLQKARTLAETSFIITSGCRNHAQNIRVGGKEDSSHLIGFAVDILVKNSLKRNKILKSLCFAGFRRIGIGKDFIHVDCDRCKVQDRIFTYYKK